MGLHPEFLRWQIAISFIHHEAAELSARDALRPGV
jgi:hypothetical protein